MELGRESRSHCLVPKWGGGEREGATQPLGILDLQVRGGQEDVDGGSSFWEQLLVHDVPQGQLVSAGRSHSAASGLSRGSHVGQTPSWPGSKNRGSGQPGSCGFIPTPSGLP